jgi:hypothetical protein
MHLTIYPLFINTAGASFGYNTLGLDASCNSELAKVEL